MLPDWIAAIFDPTAPLPAGWPAGVWGAFLLFLVPIGGGIPLGVLMARDAGVSPAIMAGMYFVSDIFMAVTHEPFFMLLGWLAGIIPALGKVRDFFARTSGRAGLRDGGKRGPLGLVLFSFTVDPISCRGAAAAAGYGFVPGWTFAIAGDMLYFGVLMAATLWLSGMFGDERVTVGAVLLLIWVISWLVRRRQDRSAPGDSSLARVAPRPASVTARAEVAAEGTAVPEGQAAAEGVAAVPSPAGNRIVHPRGTSRPVSTKRKRGRGR